MSSADRLFATWQRRLFGEGVCLVGLTLRLCPQFLIKRFVDHTQFEETPLRLRDGVTLLPFGDLCSAAVAPVVVVRRMRHQPVAACFD
jgi:hypothetical protein